MSKFNPIERYFARVLSRAPKLKLWVKLLYMRLSYCLYKTNDPIICENDMIVYDAESESFFGYYDKNPWNSSGFVLAHLSSRNTRLLPSPNEAIQIALYKKNIDIPCWTSNSAAYNWQQGSRLHWFTDEIFCYNDFDESACKYVCRFVDSVSLEQIKVLQYPVQDSFDGLFYLSINYRRLATLRPDYGYRNLPIMSHTELKNVESDGIWYCDYLTGKAVLLFSIEQICNVEYDVIFEEGFHKVNHLMISPDGKSVMFLHRYIISGERFDRLLIGNIIDRTLKVLSNNKMVSHMCWRDNSSIIGYLRGPDLSDGFWEIDVMSGEYKKIPGLKGFGDGHPSSYSDFFVADTYPDKARMQHLNLVSPTEKRTTSLGSFYHGFEYMGETRCDLHPRFKLDGNGKRQIGTVFFDTVCTGKRKLARIQVEV